MTAPRVRIQLPLILEPTVGIRDLTVEGTTVNAAFEAAFAECPLLRYHLTLDSGELRPHVLVLRNGRNLPRGEVFDTELADGDELLIHQAISGG